MRTQVNVFFSVAIVTMTVKLFTSLAEDAISFKLGNQEKVGAEATQYFIILGILNIASDLSFSGLIIYYLSTT